MVFFNYATMEMSAKIVYYGPGLCGKTTNLQQIYNITNPTSRGEMVSLATETDRTLFFDLLPIQLGTIGGFKTRFQLYTVPGQVFYNSTRKLVLKGVDAVVFVADSQEPMLDANIESLENLQDNLSDLNLSLDDIPWIIQYNKRDLPNILPVSELNKNINPTGVPYFEAIAITGKGVLETLKGISKLTLLSLKKKTGEMAEEEEEEEEYVEEEEGVEFDIDDELDDDLDDLDDFGDDEEMESFDSDGLNDDFDDDEEEIEFEDEDDFEMDDEDYSDEYDEELEDEDEAEVEVNDQEMEAVQEAVSAYSEKQEIGIDESSEAMVEVESLTTEYVGIYEERNEAVAPHTEKVEVKDIIQKVICPVILKRGQSLKDVRINLKLNVELVVKREK